MTPPPPRDIQDRRDEDNRVWSHLTHEDNAVLHRGNYFLVAESMLFVAYSLLLSKEAGNETAARMVSLFGLILCLAWMYVSWTSTRYMRHVRDEALARLPEFRQTRSTAPSNPIRTMAVFNYFVPTVVIVTWIVLFFIP